MTCPKFLPLVLLLVLSSFSFSQENTSIRFTQKDGLPSNTIYYTFQDHKNYLWIGTDKGVSRYDGYNFKNFTIADGLADTDIFQIFEDSRHRIWFVSFNGKLSYYQDGFFYSEANDTLLKKISGQGLGLKLLEDDQKNIWYLSTFSLIRISPKGIVTNFSKSSTDQSPERNYSMDYFNNTIYVITSLHLRLISKSGDTSLTYPEGKTIESTCKSTNSDNKFYFNSKKSLFVFDATHQQFDKAIELPGFSIYTGPKDEKSIYIGTEKSLFIYQKTNNKVLPVSGITDPVAHVLKDKDGGTWYSTLNNGLSYVPNPFSYKLPLVNEKQEELKKIYSLKLQKNGLICAGSDQFRFCIIKNGKQNYFNYEVNTGQGIVRNFEVSYDGDVFIPTNSALLVVDKNISKIKLIKLSAREVQFLRDSIFILSSSILFATRYTTSTITDLKKIISINKLGKSRIFKRFLTTRHFTMDENGTAYIFGGGETYKIENGKETLLKFDIEGVKTPVRQILLLENGNSIFCMSNGVLICNKTDSLFISAQQGLPSGSINSLYYEKGKNNIWLCTDNGLSCIENPKLNGDKDEYTGVIKNYGISDGLPDKHVNDLFILHDTLWIATNNGIAKIARHDLKRPLTAPVLNIENIVIDNQLNHYISGQTTETDFGRRIKISYTGVSLRNTDNLRYRYKLDGLTDLWTETSSRELEFAELPPGEYVLHLEVKAKNDHLSNVQTMKIIVRPKFYQTWWFRIGIILVLVALVSFFVLRTFKRQKKRLLTEQRLLTLENEKLAAEKKEMAYEKELLLLEQKALRLHINPHFIFNSISAISGFYISGEYEKGKEYTAKFSKLLRLILSATTNPTIKISTEIQILENYFDLMKLRFENQFDYEINVSEQIDQEQTQIPCMLFQPLAENALIHGIAPLKTKGKIRISLQESEGAIQCSVEDNGVGRKKAEENKQNNKGDSTGMLITGKRIEMHNKLMEGLTISDMVNKEGKPAGTKVDFRIITFIKHKTV